MFKLALRVTEPAMFKVAVRVTEPAMLARHPLSRPSISMPREPARPVTSAGTASRRPGRGPSLAGWAAGLRMGLMG